MNKLYQSLIIGIGVLTLIGCSNESDNEETVAEPKPISLNWEESRAMEELTDCSVKLYNSYFKADNADKNGNIVVSPLCMMNATGMLLNACEPAERTTALSNLGLTDINELNSMLSRLFNELPSVDTKGVQLTMANSLWLNDQLQAKTTNGYSDVLGKYFSAQVYSEDFGSAKAPTTINNWVAEHTEGFIKDIVQPNSLTEDKISMLISTLFFDGKWKKPFTSSKTKKGDFTIGTGEKVSVEMMNEIFVIPYAKNEDFEAITLPYGNAMYEMVIALPTVGNSAYDILQKAVDNPPLYLDIYDVNLSMPKFTCSYTYDATKILESIGVDVENLAIDGITVGSSASPVVQKIEACQKTILSVNENGTKVASTTKITGGLTAPMPKNIIFTLDRPFAFYIHEKSSHALIAMGVINNPLAE